MSLSIDGQPLWLVTAAGRGGPSAETATVPQGWALVDCDKEDAGAVQRAIERARPGDTVLVSGTCHENLSKPAAKDSITLDGRGTATIDGPDATLNTILVRARAVTITGFTITGGRVGIDVGRGASALIDANTIEGTGRFGITLGSFATANIVNNTIQNNPGHGGSGHRERVWLHRVSHADDTVASPNIIGPEIRSPTFIASQRRASSPRC